MCPRIRESEWPNHSNRMFSTAVPNYSKPSEPPVPARATKRPAHFGQGSFLLPTLVSELRQAGPSQTRCPNQNRAGEWASYFPPRGVYSAAQFIKRLDMKASENYSVRRQAAGSAFVARQAGIAQATSADHIRISGTKMNESQSRG
jgi:hypothetical protein